MSSLAYFTSRVIKDENGVVAGSIRIMVPKDSTTADVEYKCPKCAFSEKAKAPWKKPFSIKCGKCGFLIKILSLRAEIKKDKKASKTKRF